ncbi:phosphate acyltransferase PlsX [Desulfoscipio geothermicus]|uniref:Phosphate acyltransferase n=1 Tax=Desulfoscipio geothermicus DSM 3669 TaxID=1121426 RepID=A0A1I6D6X9_9FIRM|nr:phosphate acyltransferase PlsX [Desulfoscipio geothermicus]SFR01178.1 phosphate:acyl-[acyl carrier protein] acyltransferase [Desulfoscipio geothermicus DSM 3669]
MKIALDAMGGDHAPREIVRGAWEACRENGLEVVLVGDRDTLVKEIDELAEPCSALEIVHATEVIAMDEAPAVAVRRKKNASVVVAAELVRSGHVKAMVSAGSTGATMAAALLNWGRIPGIARPAIASVLPTVRGVTILLDVGANVDCKPKHLLQFAVMGSLYAQKILGIDSPRVGLVNVGEESSKGNELTQQTYPLLQEAPVNFYGNIEGRDIFQGTVDVAVCDGFVGNVVLKTGEGLADALMKMIKREMQQSSLAKIGATLTLPAMRNLKKRLDYSEYGGAPLLGVNGVAIVCHGTSRALAIKNALFRARESVEAGLIGAIGASLHDPVREVGYVDGM